MQVTNSATIVDYFPEAFVAEADDIKGMKVVIKRFNKRVYFRANGMKSYSTVTEIDARNEWESRIANGAEVTDFNLDKMPQSEYMPMACVGWIMSLIKQHLHDQLMSQDQLTEMLTLSEQIQENIQVAGELWEMSDFEVSALCGMVADAFYDKGITMESLI